MATNEWTRVIRTLHQAMLHRDEGGLTDGQLLESYVHSREEAPFAALVQRLGPMVWGVCRRVLRCHQDAEDAFQATFLVLVRRAASIRSKDLVASWLYAVARQTALKANATTARRGAREKQVATMPEPAVQQLEHRDDVLPLLDEELSALPARYRAIIALCDLEGKTRKEAAKHLKLPEGTVASRLATARSMLAKRLARQGVVLSGGTLAEILVRNAVSASESLALASHTIKAASLIAAGQAAAEGVISARAIALAEGVLKTMFLTKLKLSAAAALVMVALALEVAGFGMHLFSGLPLGMAQGQEQRDTPMRLPGKPTDRPKRDQVEQPETVVYQLGDVVQARFFLRNSGTVPIQVSCPNLITHHYYKALDVLDKEGLPVGIDQDKAPAQPVGWRGMRLGVGEHAEAYGLLMVIGSVADRDAVETVVKAKSGQTYRAQYTLPNYGDQKAGDLTTGAFTFTVLEKGAPEHRQPSAEELTRHIAWGKPGKNGLQIGLLIVPRKEDETTKKREQGPAPKAQKPDTPTTSEFPYVVRFEKGATRFSNGDKITIDEVRGTADTFAPGNIYWIKGTYTLASRDRAILLASTTVTDPLVILSPLDLAARADHVIPGKTPDADPGRATGAELTVQRQSVKRGTGNFTLFLPMWYKGSPHVSFYSFKKGEGFGGNYFGTGDSVLKHWWGSKVPSP